MNDFAVIDEDVEYAINRSSLDDHWSETIAGGFISALDNYAEEAVLELPGPDCAITGRKKIRKYCASRTEKVVRVERVRGRSDLWITKYLCSRRGACTTSSALWSTATARFVARPNILRSERLAQLRLRRPFDNNWRPS